MSRLTETTVRSMRADFTGGLSRQQIQEKYGVSYAQTQKILARKAWAHVD